MGLGVAGFHRLHYVEWGDPANPRVVVCVHGYSGNARDFDYLAEKLSTGHRVVSVDVAGRGDSDWLPASIYGFPQFLSDLTALLAHLRVREVDWIGTSMGGLLGMIVASQRNSPIRTLVMNDVGAFLPTPALQAIARNLLGPTSFPTLASIDAHLKRTHKEWGRIPPEQWKALVKHRSRKVENGYKLHYDPAIARLVQPMPLSPGIFFWDAWQNVKCPTLLLRGEESDVFPRTVADTMLLRHDNARIEEIPGCGHAPSLMLPGHVALIADFLAAPAGAVAKKTAPRASRAQRSVAAG